MIKPLASTRPLPVPIGERVGKYVLVAELGRGGMGIVYEARDSALGRKVALKCPWPELAASPEHRARFIREARIASRLNHSGIVPLLEVFEHDSLPWLAMPEIEGESLHEFLKREGRMPLDRALRHAGHMAQALQYAHAHNVLHRDITPRNVMITSGDETLLTDFGLARYLEPPETDSRITTEVTVRTTEGAVVGTPRYMSPEQVLGRELDPRSDIFSLGAVLYEMVSGRPAFGDGAANPAQSILYENPVPVSRVAGGRAKRLDRILARCLAKDPADRYASAADLVEDLERARRALEARRKTIGLRAALGAAVVAAGTAAYVLVARPEVFGLIAAGHPVRITSDEGWEGEPAVSPEGTRIAYVAEQDGRRDLFVIDIDGGSPVRLTDDGFFDSTPCWFPDGRSLAFTSNRSGTAGIWRIGHLGGSPVPLVENGAQPAVSPDGLRLAFTRADSAGDSRIFVCDLDSPALAEQRTTARDGFWSHEHPAWSPRGDLICYATASGLWKVPAAGGTAKQVLVDHGAPHRPVWRANGRTLLFASYRDNTLALWSVSRDGGEPRRLTLGTGDEDYPAISRNGRVVAYSTGSFTERIVLLDLSTGQQGSLPGIGNSTMPSLSRDGMLLVFLSERWGNDRELWIQSLSDHRPAGPPRRVYDDAEGIPSHPEISPDGRWIALYRIIEERRSLWMVPSTGGIPVRLVDHLDQAYHPAWAPDGSAVAYAGDTGGQSDIWIVPVRDGRRAGEPWRLTDTPTGELAPAWSPDGSRIAWIGSDGAENDVYFTAADGASPVFRVTTGAGATRTRWSQTGDALFVSGRWGDTDQTLRRVVVLGDSSRVESATLARMGVNELAGLFDLGDHDRLLVFTGVEIPHGDIWALR